MGEREKEGFSKHLEKFKYLYAMWQEVEKIGLFGQLQCLVFGLKSLFEEI